jgi:hypothetical protein
MANPEREKLAATRSPSEIEFVLRNTKRKSGPEVLRDVARAKDERTEAPLRPRSNRRSSESG